MYYLNINNIFKPKIINNNMIKQKFQKQREYVYSTFGEITKGTHLSNSKKTKLLKKLWKEAKKKFK